MPDSMTIFDEWLRRKLERRSVTIRETREVSHVHRRAAGPRSVYAAIQLRVEPAAALAISCDVQWPNGERAADYVSCITDGVLDELLARDVGPAVTLVRITVISIDFHPVDSSPHAFYIATRAATPEGLQREDRTSNLDWRSLAE